MFNLKIKTAKDISDEKAAEASEKAKPSPMQVLYNKIDALTARIDALEAAK